MATISLNLFGFMYCFLHLLLRSNADNMAIRPVNAPWRRNQRWKFFGSNGLDIGQHITTPICLERDHSAVGLVEGLSEKGYYIDIEASSGGSAESIKPLNTDKGGAYKPLPPPSVQKPQNATARHSRKRSNYSLFPTRECAQQMRRAPSSIYDTGDENFLLPPKAPFARLHQRHSSGISSATVQIGLRLSNVGMPLQNPFLMQPSPTGSRPNSLYGATVTNIPVPSRDGLATPKSPRVFDNGSSTRDNTSQNNVPEKGLTADTQAATDTATTWKAGSRALKKAITRSMMMKDLPPPPPLSSRNGETALQPATNLQPLLEVRSQETSPKEEFWPLPDSLTMLPKKTYRPGDEWT